MWYCQECKYIYVPEKGTGKYFQPWKDKCPIDKCPQCGSEGFIGEERVFDTWFDSSISPLYILKYDRDAEFFKNNPTCSLRPQGKEIVRTWLYYTLLKDYLLTGHCIFDNVWVNYHIVDENGKKMSKSAGNGIDPKDVLERFGAEPFRLWAALEGNLERTDFRCSFDRIEGAGKTISKLWNVSKFIAMFKTCEFKTMNEAEPHLTELDKWALNEANLLVIKCKEQYPNYDFHNPIVSIRHFIWEEFASQYLELVKNRAYNQNNEYTKEQQHAAIFTLNHILDALLKMMAPVLPLITYKVYKELYGKDIHFEEFPSEWKIHEDVKLQTEEIAALNSFIWKSKKENGKSLKDEVKHLILDEKYKSMQHDIISAHNIKSLAFSKDEQKIEF
jgi:valyl-tRNA synthetase